MSFFTSTVSGFCCTKIDLDKDPQKYVCVCRYFYLFIFLAWTKKLCALGGRWLPTFAKIYMLNKFCFVFEGKYCYIYFLTFLSGIFLGLFPKCYEKKKKVICFQKVIAQLKIMNMVQLMWKLNMSEVMWKTLEQTELRGQMIPKRNQMKLLQKVLLLLVSGQFGNHRWRTPGSLKGSGEQETFCWFWSMSWFLANLYSHRPFLGKGSKCGWCPKPCSPL